MSGVPADRIRGATPLNGSFQYEESDGGRRLHIGWAGEEMARLDFVVPERLSADDSDPLETSLHHDDVAGNWRTLVTVDNHGPDAVALPPVGVGITVSPEWSGWTWTTDVEGFLVVTPLLQEAPTLLVRISGFVRESSAVPVFTAAERRPDPGLPRTYTALHLANPTGSLKASARTRTTLVFSSVAGPEAAGQVLPRWLPDLVRDERDEIVFDTPDQAVVGGPGVTVATLGNSALVTGDAGHREVAFHDLAGVHRLRATFAPAARGPWLGEQAAIIMSGRPSAASSGGGVVVAQALAAGVARDRSGALDWLERVDWLARGDLLALSVAATLAELNHDRTQARDAEQAARGLEPGPGRSIILAACSRAAVRTGAAGGDLEAYLASFVPGEDLWSPLEAALFRMAEPTPSLVAVVDAAQRRLGGDLPGQPMRVTEAEAGYLIHLLHLVPWTWQTKEFRSVTDTAGEVARRAGRLLLADQASGLQTGCNGLAWLLLTPEDL